MIEDFVRNLPMCNESKVKYLCKFLEEQIKQGNVSFDDIKFSLEEDVLVEKMVSIYDD